MAKKRYEDFNLNKIANAKSLNLSNIENLIEKYKEDARKKKISSTKKALLTIATIAGLTIIPIPVVVYLTDRKKYMQTYIDFNLEEAEDCEIRFDKGATIANLQMAEIEGYRFDGWYSDKEYTHKLDDTDTLKDKKTIYGRYIKQITITVNFSGNRSIITVDEGTTLETAIKDIEVQELENFRFSGWHINNKYSNLANLKEELTTNKTLYGKYIETTKLLIIIDGKQIKNMVVDKGEKLEDIIKRIDIEEHDDKILDGWYIDDEYKNLLDMNFLINNSTTIYARYFNKVSVTINIDGQISTYDIKENDAIDVIYEKCNINKNNSCGLFLDDKFMNPALELSDGITLYTKISTLDKLSFIAIDEESYGVTYSDVGITGDIVVPIEHNGKAVKRVYFKDANNITNITIPYTVNTIIEESFKDCKKLLSINLPSGITEIGYGAFYNCYKLKNILFPESLKIINEEAFLNSLQEKTNITIPKNVEYIGTTAFAFCIGIENISVAKENPWYDSRNNCNALILTEGNILIKGCYKTIIPEGIEIIEQLAFANCEELINITIPKNVVAIGPGAFSSCYNLKTLIIEPNSCLQYIGEGAFSRCSALTTFTIPKNVTTIDRQAFYLCSNLGTILIENNSKLTTIGAEAFSYSLISEFAIPENIVEIGEGAFSSCKKLKSITIPSKIIAINSKTFANCDSLTSITINSNKLSTIGEFAFSNCIKLSSVFIPKTVTNIGENAFYNCGEITSIIVEDGNEKYDSRDNCNAIIESSKDILILGCRTTIIPENVLKIAGYAFYGCKGLTTITIPDRVCVIDGNAFKNSSLTDIRIIYDGIEWNMRGVDYSFIKKLDITSSRENAKVLVQGGNFMFCKEVE